MSDAGGAKQRRRGERRAGKLPEPFVPIRRRFFGSPEYLGCKPFDAVRAWFDVIYLARVTDGLDEDTGLNLRRGQLAWSHRRLADRWGWPLAKVQRWFDQKIDAGQIAVAVAGVARSSTPNVYTLVNYDFWNGWLDGPDAAVQGPVQGRDTGEGCPQPVLGQGNTEASKMPLIQGFDTGSDTDIRNARVSRKNAVKNVPGDMTPIFLEAWAAYPKRPHNNRMAAWRQWRARMRAGVSEAEMLEGTKAYAAHCRQEGKTGTEFVKMAQTFYGRDLHFRTTLESGVTESRPAFEENGDLTPEAARILGYNK